MITAENAGDAEKSILGDLSVPGGKFLAFPLAPI